MEDKKKRNQNGRGQNKISNVRQPKMSKMEDDQKKSE